MRRALLFLFCIISLQHCTGDPSQPCNMSVRWSLKEWVRSCDYLYLISSLSSSQLESVRSFLQPDVDVSNGRNQTAILLQRRSCKNVSVSFENCVWSVPFQAQETRVSVSWIVVAVVIIIFPVTMFALMFLVLHIEQKWGEWQQRTARLRNHVPESAAFLT